MIIARDHQHAPVLGGAGHVGVLEDIAAAVHPRALAIPKREHAIVLRTLEEIDLLRAPHTGGGQVFVHAGMESDLFGFQVFARLLGGLVDRAQWRAAIAGDEAGGVEAGALIVLPLQHRQADQRLDAGHEDAAALQCIFVVQGYIVQQQALPGG